MSCRDWLRHIAVRGFLILILFASSSFAQEPSEPNASADQQQPTTEREKPNETRVTPAEEETRSQNVIVRDAGATENKESETKIYRSPCGDTKDHDQADLCEQQRMSAAAERAADYAYWQLWVGTIGLPLIVGSLLFAAIAAFAARDAAIAARDQARLTEQTAERQLRAYISVGVARPALTISAIPEARLRVQNNAQTPAYDVWHWTAGKVLESGAAEWEEMPGLPRNSGKDLGADS
jgi:hypothetical protein